jgi:hypothetical protein
MRHWIVMLLIMVWFVPAQVQTKAPPTLASLEVDLWPEYDKPAMLVIYRITLDANTVLPVDLSIQIPTAVGDPAAVATREANGLFNLAYTRTVQGDWSSISFTVTSPQIQFEYYDPGLVMNGSARTFTYQWQGDYTVKGLTIQVQQPVDATQMQISPALGSPISGDGGLIYYNAMIGAVPANTHFKLSLKYQKNTATLSQSVQSVQLSENLNTNTPGRTQNPINNLAYGLGILGVLLLAGGGYWYYRTGQASKTTRIPKRRKHSQTQDEEEDINTQEAIYCAQCGKRAAAGDVFCRICGARLRKD